MNDFETFLEKATKLTESTKKSPTKGTKKSPTKLTKTSAIKFIREYKTYKKKMYLDLVNDSITGIEKIYPDLVNKSKTVISDLIRYLKKINVPGFVIVDFVLMPEDISLKKTNDLLKSYELIIEGLEHLVLNPPEDD
jgi:hypothetical protein